VLHRVLSKKLLINITHYKMFNFLKSKKFLVIGLPKSGTSILTYWIKNALPFSRLNFEPETSNGLKNIKLHEKLTSNRRVIVKCLIYDTALDFSKIFSLYDKVIWIVRDPRDQAISAFFYRWFHVNKNCKESQFNIAYQNTVKKEASPSSIAFSRLLGESDERIKYQNEKKIKWIDSYIECVRKHQRNPNVLVVRYEDIVSRKLDVLRSFLDIHISTKSTLPKGLKRVERTKNSGNWRDWFTDEDVEKIKPVYMNYLKFFGYDTEDWQLNYPKSLPREEGSLYMEKLFNK